MPPRKIPFIAWRAKNLDAVLNFYDPKNIPKFKGFGGKTRRANSRKSRRTYRRTYHK